MHSQQTTWKIFNETDLAWEAMLTDCETATSSISLEQFIFTSIRSGEIGQRFVDVFIKKQTEGVKVKLFLDAMGSYRIFTSSILSKLKKAGLEIYYFH